MSKSKISNAYIRNKIKHCDKPPQGMSTIAYQIVGKMINAKELKERLLRMLHMPIHLIEQSEVLKI